MPDAHVESSLYPEAVRERVSNALKRLSRTGALPTLPAVAEAALVIARDPGADVGELCEILEADVGLAARMLRIANSTAPVRRRPICRLADAVLEVGLRKTCDVLLAAGARHLHDATSPLAEPLWNHALATGLASAELARRTGLAEPEAAFLTGLLHDVGRIAYFLTDEVSLEVVDHLAESGEAGRIAAEHDWYGFDHAEAGAILGTEWGLAAEQCDAIRWHHSRANEPGEEALATLLGVADWIAHRMGFGDSSRVPGTPASLGSFGIDEEGLEPLLKQLLVSFARHRLVHA